MAHLLTDLSGHAGGLGFSSLGFSGTDVAKLRAAANTHK